MPRIYNAPFVRAAREPSKNYSGKSPGLNASESTAYRLHVDRSFIGRVLGDRGPGRATTAGPTCVGLQASTINDAEDGCYPSELVSLLVLISCWFVDAA